MRKLSVFESVTSNGYFADPRGDLSWAHSTHPDPEFSQFIEGNASGGGVLLFGRVTYQMMESYWPTPMAAKNDPVVAKGMNESEKVVFSRTLTKVGWQNTTLAKGDLPDTVRALKQQSGKDLVVLGSGSVVTQLVNAGLVDDFQLVVKPVVLGKGRTLFEGLDERLALKLTSSRTFRDGSVVLKYVPIVEGGR